MSTCVDCRHQIRPKRQAGPGRAHFGRGLCDTCYLRHRSDGTLVDYPRSTRSRRDTVDEYELLRTAGLSRRVIAERLGVRERSLYRALRRAAVAGV